jgi:hypothetical protein
VSEDNLSSSVSRLPSHILRFRFDVRLALVVGGLPVHQCQRTLEDKVLSERHLLTTSTVRYVWYLVCTVGNVHYDRLSYLDDFFVEYGYDHTPATNCELSRRRHCTVCTFLSVHILTSVLPQDQQHGKRLKRSSGIYDTV